MKLPGLQQAEISHHKLKNYLLDKNHVIGSPKAAFFIAHGFSPRNPDKLRKALLLHGAHNQVTEVKDMEYGIRYIIDGYLLAPDGQSLRVVAVWQIDKGKNFPRLLTAYPA